MLWKNFISSETFNDGTRENVTHQSWSETIIESKSIR
jgi:hypothetical protein